MATCFRLATAALLFGTLAMAPAAARADGAGQGAAPGGDVAQALNLTDDQKARIRAIQEEAQRRVMEVLTPEQRQRFQQLQPGGFAGGKAGYEGQKAGFGGAEAVKPVKPGGVEYGGAKPAYSPGANGYKAGKPGYAPGTQKDWGAKAQFKQPGGYVKPGYAPGAYNGKVAPYGAKPGGYYVPMKTGR